MESNFREEIKLLIAPYLREIDNVDYLALKIEYIHNKYMSETSEDAVQK